MDLNKAGNIWMTSETQEYATEYRRTDSGILVPKTLPRKYPIAFDFFAGCGGFSLGLIQAGFEVLGACEWSTDATYTYLYNLGNHPVQMYYTSAVHKERIAVYFEKQVKDFLKNNKDKTIAEFPLSGSAWRKSQMDNGTFYPGVKNFFFGDVRELTGYQISKSMGIDAGELDLVVGGPPCQGFSKAGKQDKDDPRNILVFEYARLLTELMPKSFVMEEVPEIIRMRTAQGVPVIDQFLRILEDGGYMSYEAGMKALDIREKDIGIKPKYVVKPHKGKDHIPTSKKEAKEFKKPIISTKSELTLF